MAEPFKNQLGEERIQIIAHHIKRVCSDFDDAAFLKDALEDLDVLSLMERNRQIVSAMETHLPEDFEKSASILMQSLAPEDRQEDELGIHSWLAVPISEYLGKNGNDNFEVAMASLAKVTPYFSSEWGIRYLLIDQEAASLAQLKEWCHHPHEHVRRLVSEGSRPRLPWSFQLKSFVENPELTYPLLETLRDDESDYVRLSVSNHLNDISKDHPDWLQKKLEGWMDVENPIRMKLIRHACRTLIKQGHQATLSMLGYKPFDVTGINLSFVNNKITYGESLQFHLEFSAPRPNPMILDYAIHFKKADGSLSPKVFKWKNAELPTSGHFKGKKSHAIKPITTRRYYDGEHELEILLNGKSMIKQSFELVGVND